MSEIFRDIERELRHERWLNLWQRVQPYVIGVVAGVLLMGGGWTAWRFYARAAAEQASRDFDAALILQDKNQRAAAFADLAKQSGSYGAMAAFHEAAANAQQGRWKQAANIYDELSKLANLTQGLRDLARINAAMVLVGRAPYQEIEQRLRRAVRDTAPLRHSAREVMALAALEAKNYAAARALLQSLTIAPDAPATLRARAQIMLNNLPQSSSKSFEESFKDSIN